MTAFNAVRFKAKAGREQQFLDAHNKVAFAWPGLGHVNVIKTGEHTFCVIAEWTDMDAIVNARERAFSRFLKACRACASKFPASEAPVSSTNPTWPASHIVLPPSVMTAGENEYFASHDGSRMVFFSAI